MKLFGILTAITAVSHSLVLASPIVEERGDIICLVETILINLITLNHGESFCSSYLGIQTSTVVTTTTKSFTTTTVLPVQILTTTVVTGTETTTLTSLATSQVTTTATISTASVSTATSTVSVTSTVTASPVYPTKTAGVPGPAKRSLAELAGRTLPQIPAYLSGYSAAHISAACACLNLPTPRTTSVVTASQTSTVTSTPPAATSSVLTKTVVTITTTSTSTYTETQTLTSITGTNTVTQTSTSTTTFTYTPTILSCPSREYALPGYQQQFSSVPFDTVSAPTDTTLFQCCDLCFKKQNCFSFYWGGIRTTTPEELGFCSYFSYNTSPSSVIANPPQACPLGVDTREQINYALPRPIQAYGAGPCDLSGVPFTQA